MTEEYETRGFFEDKEKVSGMVLIIGDVINKIELHDGVGEIMSDIWKLVKLRDLVDKALKDFEKDPARRV